MVWTCPNAAVSKKRQMKAEEDRWMQLERIMEGEDAEDRMEMEDDSHVATPEGGTAERRRSQETT